MIFNYDVTDLKNAIGDLTDSVDDLSEAVTSLERNAVQVITDEPLTSEDDLDDYVTAGLYVIGDTTPDNCPDDLTGCELLITVVGTTKVQTIFDVTNSAMTLHQRQSNSTGWNAWQMISSYDVGTAITTVTNAPISIAETATSNFSIIENGVKKKNNIVTGLLMLRVDSEWSANNNTSMVIFGNGWKPASYQMLPAIVTSSQWQTTGELANLAYINTNGYMVLNWTSAIPAGKYIKINLNYLV